MNFLFISSTVLVVAGIVDNILNGLARPTFGWVSDHIGRENTMAIVFTCRRRRVLGARHHRQHALDVHRDRRARRTFTWGEIYSLFPATCTDTYGSKYARHQCGPAVHREGRRGVPGAGGELAAKLHRRLARGLRRGDDRESGGCRHRLLHRQADAGGPSCRDAAGTLVPE